MSAERRHLLLVNPSAGGGRVRELLPRARAALDRSGIVYDELQTTSIEHGREEALRAAGERRTCIVMSGDGLIGQVGGALAGSGAVIGIMPGGRGNDLARVLGIPTELERAAELIAAGETRQIDVGEVNGRRFLGIASCGFDSDANRIANEARFVRGNMVYLYAAVRALAAWKPARFELRLDDEAVTVKGYAVAVANSRAYGGGMFIAPGAELDDGLLDVVWTGQVGKLRFLANLPKVFRGRHVDNAEVTVSRAAEVQVEADRPFAVYADGDHITNLPASLRVLPRALEILAPPGPLLGPPA